MDDFIETVFYSLRNNMANEALVNQLRLYFQGGGNSNARMANGDSILHLASGKGDVEIVKLLIEYGADLDYIDMDGWAPIHYAAFDKRVEVTRLLLEAGADPNIKTPNGCTPLHLLSYPYRMLLGAHLVAKILIDNGANINALDCNGSTPLHNAASFKKSKVLTVLLDAGCDTEIVNDVGLKAVTLCGDKICRELLEGGGVATKSAKKE